jgi:hypothetical protein
MTEKTKHALPHATDLPLEPGGERHGRRGSEEPEVLVSVLEVDQLVAIKEKTHFGRRQLSGGQRILLWLLRGYVIAMMAIVLLSVFQAIRSAHP